jgi:hypothetical protein
LNTSNYYYNISGFDSTGIFNTTETRILNVISTSLSISTPNNYQIYQRINATTGTIKITGTYSGSNPIINASFNNAPFQTIYSNSSGGNFVAYLNATVGQGNLTIQLIDGNQTINVTKSNISIGDIFVISGQSNSVMQGTSQYSLNSSNQYVAVKYKSTGWSPANDPIPYYTATATGSSFPILADYIVQNQSVPVGFINTGYNNNGILKWTQDTGLNDTILAISSGTNGMNRIKAFLFYQGENDISGSVYGISPAGDYDSYKNNLTWLIDQWSQNITFDKFILGQVNRQGGAVTNTDNIRKAQLDLWYNKFSVARGVITYDIGALPDGIHYKTDQEIREMARRWWASVGSEIYQVGQVNPILTEAVMQNSTQVFLKFNSTSGLTISVWNDSDTNLAKGIQFKNGTNTITDASVTKTEISGNNVIVTLSSPVDLTYNITLGSAFTNYGLPTLRGNDSFRLPVEPVYGMRLTTDSSYPIFSASDNNGTLTNSGIGLFNVTVENTNGTVWLNINGENISSTNQSNIFLANYSFTQAGTYQYRWYAYGNGSTNLLNQSEVFNYVVKTTTESPNGGSSWWYTNKFNETIVCDFTYSFLVDKIAKTGGRNYTNEELNNLTAMINVQMRVKTDNSTVKLYLDEFEKKCGNKLPKKKAETNGTKLIDYTSGISPCTPDINSTFTLLNAKFNMDNNIPFFNIEIGRANCVSIESLRWLFKIEKAQDRYTISGIKLWWVLVLSVILAISLIYRHSRKSQIPQMPRHRR